MLMIQKADLLADKLHRGLIQSAGKGYRPILCHCSFCRFPEMVFKVLRRGSDALYVACKTLQGSIPRAVMPSVIIARYPGTELLVEIFKGRRFIRGQETAPDSAEPALNLALALGLIGTACKSTIPNEAQVCSR